MLHIAIHAMTGVFGIIALIGFCSYLLLVDPLLHKLDDRASPLLNISRSERYYVLNITHFCSQFNLLVNLRLQWCNHDNNTGRFSSTLILVILLRTYNSLATKMVPNRHVLINAPFFPLFFVCLLVHSVHF